MQDENKSTTSTQSEDDIILSKMGYKKDLHRGLDAFMNFAFGYTEVAVLVGICSLYSYGLVTGGPAALVWGWVVSYAITMIVSLNLAEICGAYPSAGSVYHWSGQLVSQEWSPLISYICGWANFLGNAAGDASFAFTWATFLDASLLASGVNDQEITVDVLVAISIGVLLVWSLLNILRIDNLGWVNNIAAFIHCGSTVIILIALLVSSKRLATVNYVFTGFNNETGFTSLSYVTAISLLAALYSFSGYEASAHMAEETTQSRTSAPKGIIYTCLATGAGGLVLILGLLFATTDIQQALHGKTSNAAVNVFLFACGESIGAFLSWLVVINIFFAGVSSVAVTGRITFALSRDNAFPFSPYISKVHPTLKSPVNAILFVWLLDSLLQLLPLVSTVAFVSITGITTIGFQVSYGIPIFLKVLFDTSKFPITPMSLGSWSKPMGIISSIWLFGTSCLFFLPTSSPITPSNMNYTIIIVTTVFITGTVNWIFNARFFFKGPLRTDGLAKSTDIT